MKILKYEKPVCELCGGMGAIDIKLPTIYLINSVECPLCNGKGHLNIINIEETNNV